MSVKIEHRSTQNEELWSVNFGDHSVELRNERSARNYAATLKERIEAPHTYPQTPHATRSQGH